jgi:hypothetical protein
MHTNKLLLSRERRDNIHAYQMPPNTMANVEVMLAASIKHI